MVRSGWWISGTVVLLLSGCAEELGDPLHFEEAGSGETVVFVHGAQEDYRLFLPQVDALQHSYRAVTYSRRYNHPNQNAYDPGFEYSVFSEAEDLNVLVDRLGGEPVHLVGHSYGGLVAMVYADRHPGKVRSLILSEPPVLRLEGCESWYEHAQEALIGDVSEAFASGDSTRVMGAIFEFFAGADVQDLVPPEFLDALFANLTEMEALVHSEDPFPELTTELAPPVLIITAGNTMPMLECTNQALVRRMPDAEHLHLPEATHDLWTTHPDELASAVQAFLSRVSG